MQPKARLTQETILVLISLLLCSVLGCSNASWLDKYGEALCVSMESHVKLVRSIKDPSELKKIDKTLEQSADKHSHFESEVVNYSYTQNTSDLKLDQVKLAALSKRMDIALDELELEAERVMRLAGFGTDKEVNHALSIVLRNFENPFNPSRKRYLERQSRNQNLESSPPPPE